MVPAREKGLALIAGAYLVIAFSLQLSGDTAQEGFQDSPCEDRRVSSFEFIADQPSLAIFTDDSWMMTTPSQ